VTSLIALGGNLHTEQTANAETLDQAIIALNASDAISVSRQSSWHAYAPVGGPANQPQFLNGAAVLETSLDAPALLARMLEIEDALGRQRRERWGSRRIDLDLLLHDLNSQSDNSSNGGIHHTNALTVPHLRMGFRRFVLEPCAEIAADFLHPHFEMTVGELLANLNEAKHDLAIIGDEKEGPTADLANELSISVRKACNAAACGSPEEVRNHLLSDHGRPPKLVLVVSASPNNFEFKLPDFRGPVMPLPMHDPATAFQEAVAAFEAMR